MSFQSLGFLAFLAVTVAVCRMAALFYDWQAHVQPWPADPVRERFVHRNSVLLALMSLIFYLFGCTGDAATQLGVPLLLMTYSRRAGEERLAGLAQVTNGPADTDRLRYAPGPAARRPLPPCQRLVTSAEEVKQWLAALL